MQCITFPLNYILQLKLIQNMKKINCSSQIYNSNIFEEKSYYKTVMQLKTKIKKNIDKINDDVI